MLSGISGYLSILLPASHLLPIEALNYLHMTAHVLRHKHTDTHAHSHCTHTQFLRHALPVFHFGPTVRLSAFCECARKNWKLENFSPVRVLITNGKWGCG